MKNRFCLPVRNEVMLMPLTEAIDINVPPDLAETFGYTWMPSERYICFHWANCKKRSSLELIWFDGVMRGFADHRAWYEFVNHFAVAPILARFELGGPISGKPSKECLLLDTTDNQIYCIQVASGYALARCVGGQSFRTLPVPQQSDYRKAANTILRQPFDRTQLHDAQVRAISQVKEWLDADLPF